MNKIGLVRAAAFSPVLKVANPDFNSKEIIKCIKEAEAMQVKFFS